MVEKTLVPCELLVAPDSCCVEVCPHPAMYVQHLVVGSQTAQQGICQQNNFWKWWWKDMPPSMLLSSLPFECVEMLLRGRVSKTDCSWWMGYRHWFWLSLSNAEINTTNKWIYRLALHGDRLVICFSVLTLALSTVTQFEILRIGGLRD